MKLIEKLKFQSNTNHSIKEKDIGKICKRISKHDKEKVRCTKI